MDFKIQLSQAIPITIAVGWVRPGRPEQAALQ